MKGGVNNVLYLPFLGGVIGAGIFCALTWQLPDAVQQSLQATHGASAVAGAMAAGLVGWAVQKTNHQKNYQEAKNMQQEESRANGLIAADAAEEALEAFGTGNGTPEGPLPETETLEGLLPEADPEQGGHRASPAPSAIEQVKESLRMAQALMDEIEKSERSRHYMLTMLQAAEGAMEDCAVAADDLADKFSKAHALLVELSVAVRKP